MGRGGSTRPRVPINVGTSTPDRLLIPFADRRLTALEGERAFFDHAPEPDAHPVLVRWTRAGWSCSCLADRCVHVRDLGAPATLGELWRSATLAPGIADNGTGKRIMADPQQRIAGAHFFVIDGLTWRVDPLTQTFVAVQRTSTKRRREEVGFECVVELTADGPRCRSVTPGLTAESRCPATIAVSAALTLVTSLSRPIIEVVLGGPHKTSARWSWKGTEYRGAIQRSFAYAYLRMDLRLLRDGADGELAIAIEGTGATERHPLRFRGARARCSDQRHATGRGCFVDRMRDQRWLDLLEELRKKSR